MLNASDIQTLEARWKKWQFKRVVKKIAFFALFLSLGGAYFLIQHFSLNSSSKELPHSETKEVASPAPQEVLPKEPPLKKNDALSQRPSLSIQPFPSQHITQEPSPALLPPEPEVLPALKPEIVTKTNNNPPPQERVETLEITPPRINIEYKTTQRDTTAYLREKFDSTKNIVFALMLSEEYYGLEDYPQARKWALIANEADPKNERSWILFAMAQAKLDNTKEAISALEEFLKNNSSTNAQLLLDKLKKGTFK